MHTNFVACACRHTQSRRAAPREDGLCGVPIQDQAFHRPFLRRCGPTRRGGAGMRQDGIHAQRDGQRSQFLTREAHQILGAGEVGGGFRPIKEAGAIGAREHQRALAARAVPNARNGSGASLQAAGAGSFTAGGSGQSRSRNPAARPRHGYGSGQRLGGAQWRKDSPKIALHSENVGDGN